MAIVSPHAVAKLEAFQCANSKQPTCKISFVGMIGRILQPRIQAYTSGLVLSSPFVAYSLCPQRRPIWNESSKQGEWSKTRASAARSPAGDKDPQSSPTSQRNDSEDESHSWFGDDEGHAWASFSQKLSDAGSAISSIEWSSFGDRVADFVMPSWAKVLPAYVKKLQLELSMGHGSLAEEIMQEAADPNINPETTWRATVRISPELCDEEKVFQTKRKRYTRQALARYLGLPEKDIHPNDVPTIAMCGSGGGLRALISGTSSYLCTQEAGLLDCVTYTAGVSGSCWQQALYHSTLAKQNYGKLIDHLKKRLGVHIAFPPAALQLLTSAPTNKFLLSGFVEKSKSDPDADFGLVDIYGLLLAARLLVPRGELEVEARDLKLSNQRSHLQDGAHPMPIYTAVRHELPLEQVKSEDNKDAKDPKATEELKEKAKQEAWFQWFEWTPYEFWSEEIGAGIPTFSLGRKFDKGVSVPRDHGLENPEIRLPNLLGIWGSAFCATLSHYYKEVRPLLKGIAGFKGVDDMINQRNEDLVKVHPLDPATIPNFACGLDGQLPSTCPESILKASHLQLMDAGMSNNLPIYPLLRPGRDVDILVAFDASADIQKDNWLSVADGYAHQRGIKGWPVGIGWPPEQQSHEQSAQELDKQQPKSSDEAVAKLAQAQDTGRQSANQSEGPEGQDTLGYCTIWVGSAEERSAPADSPPSKRVDPHADWNLLAKDQDTGGLAIIYFPLLPNPKAPGVDPKTSEFLSTWNFVYTPEQIDKVVALARANFDEGKEQTRRCVRAVYERKKKARLEREDRELRAWQARSDEEQKKLWRKRLKGTGNHFS